MNIYKMSKKNLKLFVNGIFSFCIIFYQVNFVKLCKSCENYILLCVL